MLVLLVPPRLDPRKTVPDLCPPYFIHHTDEAYRMKGTPAASAIRLHPYIPHSIDPLGDDRT